MNTITAKESINICHLVSEENSSLLEDAKSISEKFLSKVTFFSGTVLNFNINNLVKEYPKILKFSINRTKLIAGHSFLLDCKATSPQDALFIDSFVNNISRNYPKISAICVSYLNEDHIPNVLIFKNEKIVYFRIVYYIENLQLEQEWKAMKSIVMDGNI